MRPVSTAPRPDGARQGLAPAALVAGAVCAVYALALLVAAGLYLRELVTGTTDVASAAALSLVVTAIFTVLLAAMARGWFTGRRWPRTPTVVWCLLTLPAIWTLNTSNGLLVAAPLAVLSIAGLLAAMSSPAADLPEDTVH